MHRGKPELERASYRGKSRTAAKDSALKQLRESFANCFSRSGYRGLAFALVCHAEMLGVVQFD